MSALIENSKSITLLIKEKDLASVKLILKYLKNKYPAFTAMKFRTGKIGDDILVTFSVKEEFYNNVLEKFAFNDIPIILKNKNSLDYVKSKKEQKRKKLNAQGWSEITVTKRQPTIKELIELAKKGKVKDIAKEARGSVGSNIEIVKKAKSLLTESIQIAIDNLVNIALEKPRRTQDTIDELLLIATDKDLKLFHKYEDMNKAGLTAIELSLSDEKYFDNLISIANNSKLDNLTNIRSFVAIADLIEETQNQELSIAQDAIKGINTRWQRIAFETVQLKLNTQEIQKFASLIDFIEKNRLAA